MLHSVGQLTFIVKNRRKTLANCLCRLVVSKKYLFGLAFHEGNLAAVRLARSLPSVLVESVHCKGERSYCDSNDLEARINLDLYFIGKLRYIGT